MRSAHISEENRLASSINIAANTEDHYEIEICKMCNDDRNIYQSLDKTLYKLQVNKFSF